MARSFASASVSDRIQNTSFTNNSSSGTISIWLKPTWSSGDSASHVIWFFGQEGVKETPSFQKFSDNNIYVGFNTGGGTDQRIVIADTGLFTAGNWANWVFTYASTGCVIYKNAVSKGTFGATTILSAACITIGNYKINNTGGFGGSLDKFCFINRVVTAGELTALANGALPPYIGNSVNLNMPLDGIESPEPDLSSGAFNGTLTNTARSAGSPTMMFTPRWPNNVLPASAPSAISFRKTASRIGTRTGTRQTWAA